MQSPWRKLWLSLLVSLLVGEGLVRLIATHSVDGETWVSSALLRPYKLPLRSVPASLKKYAESADIRLRYDAKLGWSPPPNSSFDSGRYRYNAAGIRDSREFGPFPASGTLRIMLFGDSFVHGDDVDGVETLGAHLQELLHHSGIEAEVLNAGVSAFGLDQAYLRWQVLGSAFHPDLVICGFQPENVKRDLNIHRYFYTHRSDEIPFTKPRFDLQDDKLILLNSPTVPLESLPEFLATFPNQPLRAKEHFFSPPDFEDFWLYQSKFLAFSLSFLLTSNKYVYEAQEKAYYQPQGEAAILAKRILSSFDRDVRNTGAGFVLLYIPKLRHLAESLQGNELPYSLLLHELETQFSLVDPRPELISGGGSVLSSLYSGEVHYSSAGNEAVARSLVPVVAEFQNRKNL